jgi:hypothetical protein
MSAGGTDTPRLPALSFRHQPGTMQARFYHGTFDYIELGLRMGGATTWVQEVEPGAGNPLGPEIRHAAPSVEQTVYFSSAFCAFPSFIRFLEAITIGVEECGFTWDPEGPHGHMQWHSGDRDEGTLRLAWSSRDEKFDGTTPMRTHDAVGTLYTAFRAFVDSPEYEPFRYERLQEWDAYSLILEDATLGQFARAVASLPAVEAGAVLDRAWNCASARERCLEEDGQRRQTLEWFMLARPDTTTQALSLPDSWDGWSQTRRTRYLGRRWSGAAFGVDGANLRHLRSKAIEEWLSGGRARARPYRPAQDSARAKLTSIGC